jgi:hypothetical protein
MGRGFSHSELKGVSGAIGGKFSICLIIITITIRRKEPCRIEGTYLYGIVFPSVCVYVPRLQFETVLALGPQPTERIHPVGHWAAVGLRKSKKWVFRGRAGESVMGKPFRPTFPDLLCKGLTPSAVSSLINHNRSYPFRSAPDNAGGSELFEKAMASEGETGHCV